MKNHENDNSNRFNYSPKREVSRSVNIYHTPSFARRASICIVPLRRHDLWRSPIYLADAERIPGKEFVEWMTCTIPVYHKTYTRVHRSRNLRKTVVYF